MFKEEGFRRSNIFKDNIHLGIHLLGLTKEDWDNGKSEVYKKFKQVLDKFEILIQFDTIEKQNLNGHVDEIEAVRAKNKIYRMNTTRVVFEKFQDTVEKVSDIEKIPTVTQYPLPVELTEYNEDEKEMNRQFWELYDREIKEIKSQSQHSNDM